MLGMRFACEDSVTDKCWGWDLHKGFVQGVVAYATGYVLLTVAMLLVATGSSCGIFF